MLGKQLIHSLRLPRDLDLVLMTMGFRWSNWQEQANSTNNCEKLCSDLHGTIVNQGRRLWIESYLKLLRQSFKRSLKDTYIKFWLIKAAYWILQRDNDSSYFLKKDNFVFHATVKAIWFKTTINTNIIIFLFISFMSPTSPTAVRISASYRGGYRI